jgi:hypothetical protein
LNAPGSCARATAAVVALAAVCAWAPAVHAGAADSLLLHAPTGVIVSAEYDTGTQRFVNYILWNDIPINQASLVEPPSPWGLSTSPPASLAAVQSRGVYNGTIDRTVVFAAQDSGIVGVDLIELTYDVRLEALDGRIAIPPSYMPGTWIPVLFENGTVDLGLEINVGPGRIDLGGTFSVGLQNCEGFHIWRGTLADGSDLEIIGEFSKQEASLGNSPGGSFQDSLYFYDVVPTLRQGRPWISPFGAIECLGTSINLPLAANQFFWWDCNASNGFTYYYMVTSFDRGYISSSSQQGLVKVDNCFVTLDQPVACPDEMERISMEVAAQSDLYNVYVVPNPYRSGGSRLTTSNYHNFPDDLIRFVNVPADCTIKIFTVSGDLVWENVQSNDGGNVTWDLTNRGAESVTSGVYIYRIEKTDGDSVYGRIVVIR